MVDVKSEKNAIKTKRKLNYVVLGLAMFLLGAFTMFGFRFATFEPDDVHFHANFALYINGTKDEFKNFTFYKEVAACSVHNEDDVESRVHMHDENPSLVHVHAHGVTWGAFFSNLGYTLGNKAITTDDGTFVDAQGGNALSFILNGEQVKSIQNKLIQSEDVLLINYGKDEQSTLLERSKSIPSDAKQANATADPATCSGSEDTSLTKRFRAALGLRTH